MQLTKCKNGWLAQMEPGANNITYFASLHAAADALEVEAPTIAASPAPKDGAQGPVVGAETPAEPPKKRGRPPKAAVPASIAGLTTEPSNADPGDQHPLPLPDSKPPQPVAAPAPAPTPQAAAPTPPAAGASGSKLTLDDARAALGALNSKHGLVMAKGALSRFGCQRISEVKPEQFADFIALCKKGVETGEV